MCNKQWRSCVVWVFFSWCKHNQSGPDLEQHLQRVELRLVVAGSLPHHHPTARSHRPTVRTRLTVHSNLFYKHNGFFNELLFIQRRNLQILVSPNPALASKSALLPWSGQIYVQCNGQQKVETLVCQKISIVLRKYNAVWLQFIKVQIRPDLALDVSSAPANTSLSALPPQAATPVLPVNRLITNNPVPPQTPQSPSALVEINSKTIVFPATYSGEMSGRTKPPRGQIGTLFTLV